MGERLHTHVSPLNREYPAGCMLLHACSCWSRWFPNLCLTESGGSALRRPRRLRRRGAEPVANQGPRQTEGHHTVKRSHTPTSPDVQTLRTRRPDLASGALGSRVTGPDLVSRRSRVGRVRVRRVVLVHLGPVEVGSVLLDDSLVTHSSLRAR